MAGAKYEFEIYQQRIRRLSTTKEQRVEEELENINSGSQEERWRKPTKAKNKPYFKEGLSEISK